MDDNFVCVSKIIHDIKNGKQIDIIDIKKNVILTIDDYTNIIIEYSNMQRYYLETIEELLQYES
jgi:menaquinone-dependent protoporphyrinogen IX oxidase